MFGRKKNNGARDALRDRIWEPHVAPLNALADRITDSEGLAHGVVPYVDPNQGGIAARALILLDNPGRRARVGTGSGILSLDNNDPTSERQRDAYTQFGVDWKDIVTWNVCPAPTENPDVNSGASLPAERTQYAHWTKEFMMLCPNLEIMLPLGGSARDG